MKPVFPSSEWLNSLCDKLNQDKKYAVIAAKWEGDICVVIEPSGNIKRYNNILFGSLAWKMQAGCNFE